MGVDPDVEADLDIDANAATVTITERGDVEIADLLDENGDVRLWGSPSAGLVSRLQPHEGPSETACRR